MKMKKTFVFDMEYELYGDETPEEIDYIKNSMMDMTGDEISELFNDVNGKVGVYVGKLVNVTEKYEKLLEKNSVNE